MAKGIDFVTNEDLMIFLLSQATIVEKIFSS